MKKLLLLVSSLFLVFSCTSSTKLMSSWKRDGAATKNFKKLMVVGMFPNLQTRITLEEAVVRHLKAQGVHATIGYDLFPMAGKAEELLAMARDSAMVASMKNNVQRKIKENGVDGLMMISAFDIQKTEQYNEGASVTVVGPAYGYYPGYYGGNPYAYTGGYHDYYAYSAGTVHSQGYYTTSTSYYLQSNLFETNDDKLIYAVQTKTVDYTNLNTEADLFAGLLVKDMVEKQIMVVTPQTRK